MSEYKWSLSSDPFPDWEAKDWSADGVKHKVQAIKSQLCFVTDFVRQLDINMAKKVVKMDFTRAVQSLEGKIKEGAESKTWELEQALEQRDHRISSLEEQLKALQDEVRSGNERLQKVGGERAILQKGTLEIVKKRVLEDLKKEVHIEANKKDISEYVENAVAKRMDAVKSKFTDMVTQMQEDQGAVVVGGTAARVRRKIAKAHGIGSWRINELWKQMADPNYKPKELSPEEEEDMKQQDEIADAEEEEARQQALLLNQLSKQSSRTLTEIDFLKSEVSALRDYASGSALHLQEEVARQGRDLQIEIAKTADQSRALVDAIKGDSASIKKEIWDSLSVLQMSTQKSEERLGDHDLQYKELELRVKQGIERASKESRGIQRVLDAALEELKFDVAQQTKLTLDSVSSRIKVLEDKGIRTDTTYWELHEKTKAATEDLASRFRTMESFMERISEWTDPRKELDMIEGHLEKIEEKDKEFRAEMDHLTGRIAEVQNTTEDLQRHLEDWSSGQQMVVTGAAGSSGSRPSTRPNSAASRRSGGEGDDGLPNSGSGGIQISSLQELYIALEEEIQAEANKRAVAFGDILRILVPFRQAVLAELASKSTYQDVEALVRQLLAGGNHNVGADADDVVFQWQRAHGIDSSRRWSPEPRSWSRCSNRSQDPVDSLYNIDLPRVNTKVTKRGGSQSSGQSGQSGAGATGRPPSARGSGPGGQQPIRIPRPPSARGSSHNSLPGTNAIDTSDGSARPTSAPSRRGKQDAAALADTLNESLTIRSATTMSSQGGRHSRPGSAQYLP